jgi:hypothetical protein
MRKTCRKSRSCWHSRLAVLETEGKTDRLHYWAGGLTGEVSARCGQQKYFRPKQCAFQALRHERTKSSRLGTAQAASTKLEQGRPPHRPVKGPTCTKRRRRAKDVSAKEASSAWRSLERTSRKRPKVFKKVEGCHQKQADGRYDRLQQLDVVPERRAEAALLHEVPLHVDHHHRCGLQLQGIRKVG